MKIYSVTQLREELNELLGQVTVAVEGEIAELRITQNRFVWFSLVDEQTTVKCFMLTFQMKTAIEDGMRVRAIGSPTLFKKGQFVFRPRQIEVLGAGSVQEEYERVKKQLTTEGIFDESRKRSVPRFPQSIGLVTSVDAAAYTDVLRILKNRWSGLSIVHAPVNVQGANAAFSIVSALHQLNEERPDLDCIILTRGGGSMEDLHAFNDEAVVRAVFASRIPIVAGVGHERDVTLVDLAADVRASTPSNAAERVVPDKRDVIEQLQYLTQHATRAIEKSLQSQSNTIDSAIGELEDHARAFGLRVHSLDQRLWSAGDVLMQQVQFYQQKIEQTQRHMTSLHPRQVLKRGYGIVRLEKGKVIQSAKEVHPGDHLSIEIFDGTIDSQVTKV